ncbi:universal stress protein [Variovorax sp.]|uniref:universal stress protein n=1 Tax=Variovorax sp. TaxID=1871043 RepID=UPI002D3F531A|nr:universal stress protein [Variovorax sp.]HYP85978.1 universal stress protein [Variovorax sp.]
MYEHILVPFDGSNTSKLGLAEAIRLARLTGGRLRLMYVIDELSFALTMDAYAGLAGDWLNVLREEGARLLDEGKSIAAASGIEADTALHDAISGKLADSVALEALQWPADVIVLGTHGRRGIGRWVLGSGAESIVRSAPVPVLLVRAPEAVAAQMPASAGTQAQAHVQVPSAALSIE